MLSLRQKQEFYENGYLVVPGVVSQLMTEAARKAINRSVGEVGMHEADPSKFRKAMYCSELCNQPVITDLFNESPFFSIAESLLGKGNVQAARSGQIPLRFPNVMDGAPEPRGHLDGLGSGNNSMAKGVYRRGFTAFAVVYLSDVPETHSGNFTVWPRSHRFFEDYFKNEGHEVLANGMPRPELPEGPVMITGKAGDVVIAHHQIVHGPSPNASSNIRYAAIFRVRHVDVETNGLEAYTDIWREFAGVQEVMEEVAA